MVWIPLSYFLFYGFYQSLTYKKVLGEGIHAILFSLMNHYGLVQLTTFLYLCHLTGIAASRHDMKIRTYKQITMSKVFQVKPKRIKRTNGTVLTPEMVVTVTTQQHTTNPFYNGAKELQEAYMRLYAFDYKKACCNQNDFEFVKLD